MTTTKPKTKTKREKAIVWQSQLVKIKAIMVEIAWTQSAQRPEFKKWFEEIKQEINNI